MSQRTAIKAPVHLPIIGRFGRWRTGPLVAHIRELLAGGMGKLKIARQLGIGTSVVQRIAAAGSTG
jgi:hypothetical protein